MTTIDSTHCVSVDEDGLIIHVSRSLADLLVWRPEELIGRPLTAIIPERFQDSHNLGFSRFLSTGVGALLNQPLPLPVRRHDGTELKAELRISAQEREGRWAFTATVSPREGEVW